MTSSAAYDPTPLLATWFVLVLLGIGVHVWYALMLSKVFARLGAETGKAWVPILNEAEILRLGGVPAWSVVFFLLPVVQFYGLYLKAVATSRINAHFGRGAGSTALAILLPPVWATLLAGGARTADPALEERIAPSVAERSGYAFAVTPQPPSDPLPPAPVPPAPLPPAGGVPFVPVKPPAPVAPPVVPPAPAPGLLPPPPGAAAPGPIVAPPGLVIPPPPVVPAAPPVAPEIPAQPWAPLDRPIAPPPVAAPAPEPANDAEDADAGDELDRTVVVDRRPVVPWVLIVDDGPTLRLSGTRVVLGRRPSGAGEDAQELAVPDPTRTLSKVHARLDLADGVWTVTDLDATNGVIVVGADGAENLLDPGASAPVLERFVLGKVGLRLVVAEGDVDR